jgi:hypothetical protein
MTTTMTMTIRAKENISDHPFAKNLVSSPASSQVHSLRLSANIQFSVGWHHIREAAPQSILGNFHSGLEADSCPAKFTF